MNDQVNYQGQRICHGRPGRFLFRLEVISMRALPLPPVWLPRAHD